jgi:hypothetical protein
MNTKTEKGNAMELLQMLKGRGKRRCTGGEKKIREITKLFLDFSLMTTMRQ